MRACVLVVLLGVPVLARAADQGATTSRVVPLETFEKYASPTFPAQWKVRGDEDEARAIYSVVEEHGNRFLHAHAEHQGVQIGLSHPFQPKEFPLLRWRWRVKQLPPGADERFKQTNDSAAAVYVVFGSRLLPHVIKYVWSATLPAGARVDNPMYGRAKVVVLESGPSGTGEWRQETVNLYQDYQELFGAEPEEAQGVAVLTDSDTTDSIAEADYDDFALVSAEPRPVVG